MKTQSKDSALIIAVLCYIAGNTSNPGWAQLVWMFAGLVWVITAAIRGLRE